MSQICVGGWRWKTGKGVCFKECIACRDEIRALWREFGKASVGNKSEDGSRGRKYRRRKGFDLGGMGSSGPGTTVKRLLSDDRFTDAVIAFLKATKVVDCVLARAFEKKI